MKRSPVARPDRLLLLAVAALCATLGTACTSTSDGLLAGDKVDYRAPTVKTKPLEVPPDLTQLARESRYQPQGGVVSAAANPGAVAAQVPGSATPVAPLARGDIRVERQGEMRWLVVPMPPEQLWPLLKTFWQERGFTLATESAETGVMETDWAENRAKLPQDFIRSSIGRIFGGLYDSGERDMYRTRVERTDTGSEVFISHRGLEEVYTDERKENTRWRVRPSDPQLEAEFLSRLMARLGPQETVARAAVANAPEQPARARALAGAGAALEVDEPFDRAWRRVGLVLDRSGFTVEDRDRAAGLYFVRYIDPKSIGKEEPGFFSKLFGADGPTGPQRYRISVKGSENKSVVSVLTSSGAAESGENGRLIAERLVNELR
ncbi:outer membrane protein assembly factor BamC [Rubrivivax sp. RP6-9]|uniref:outer membrane protein assembly factor BamC n=1 Tax=Rubrivivax sp. RP6-9 TaxID=3415750 RepID=UPI003CC6AE4E